MSNRRYYAEREGLADRAEVDFDMLKRMFLNIYVSLKDQYFFQEAQGYICVDDGEIYGIWGADHEAFVFSKLRMNDLWPLDEKLDSYNEADFFTMVEFLHDYVSSPEGGRYHSFANCGWHGTSWNRDAGKQRFREEVNRFLSIYRQGYELSDQGEVLESTPTGLESLVSEVAQSGDAENIDNRVRTAISKFRRHDATLDDKKEAIRTLGDVLEFLKRSGSTLPRPDDSDLFQILNRFDIRHHNPNQASDYSREEFFPWIFYTILASIDFLIRLNS